MEVNSLLTVRINAVFDSENVNGKSYEVSEFSDSL